jgi:hypothetical protein
VSINSDQSLQYTPGPEFHGRDTFTYQLTNSGDLSATVEIRDLAKLMAGNYAGLTVSDPVLPSNSGFMRVKIASKGSLSGQLQYAGVSYVLRGALNLEGHYSQTIPRPHSTPLVLTFSKDDTLLSGSISESGEGGSTVAITAKKSSFTKTNPFPFPGKYSVKLPLQTASDDAALPHTSAVAILKVNTLGVSRLTGKLGDRTPVSVSGLITDENQLPFYTGLYRNKSSDKGSLFGNIQFQSVEALRSSLDSSIGTGHRLRNYFRPGLRRPSA